MYLKLYNNTKHEAEWVTVRKPYSLRLYTMQTKQHVTLRNQSIARLTQEPEVSGSILGPATYFRF